MFDPIIAGLFLAQVLLSSLDGLYLHLWKYRLHERPESRAEHILHSLRAWLFLPFLLLLAWQPSGGLLSLLLGLIGIDIFVGLADVLEEHRSRKSLGGLSRGEYFLHVILIMLHSTVLSLSLAALLLKQSVTPALLSTQGWSAWLAEQMIPGTVLVALLHVWLIAYPDSLRRLQQRWPGCCSQPAAL